MRSLWLFYLPLLFLPNLVAGKTSFGVLEFSDYLMGPFLLLVGMAGRSRNLLVGRVRLLLGLFVAWALFSTLLIRERYNYPDYYQVLFGLMKLGKFFLYIWGGLLAVRALAEEGQRRWFLWSLLAVGLVVAFSLAWYSNQAPSPRPGGRRIQVIEAYKASNSVSVMMAMIICELGACWLDGQGSPLWRKVAGPGLAAMILGWLLTNGRGGWLAGLAGALYLFYRRGLSVRTITGLAGAVLVAMIAYAILPTFQKAVDLTINPSKNYLKGDWQVIEGVDDGARLTTWGHEASKLVASPLLGTGFYHRGGASGLFTTGSHNFFIQMFLETGIVGGLLILGLFTVMWRQAGREGTRAAGLDIPVRSALVAAFVGGLSGEYFYGGVVPLSLLLIYAPVGCLPGSPGEESR